MNARDEESQLAQEQGAMAGRVGTAMLWCIFHMLALSLMTKEVFRKSKKCGHSKTQFTPVKNKS